MNGEDGDRHSALRLLFNRRYPGDGRQDDDAPPPPPDGECTDDR